MQVPSEKELLQKELKSINWKEVDEYPSVVDCEKIEDKKQRQQCFFEVLTQLIFYQKIQKKAHQTLSKNNLILLLCFGYKWFLLKRCLCQ